MTDDYSDGDGADEKSDGEVRTARHLVSVLCGLLRVCSLLGSQSQIIAVRSVKPLRLMCTIKMRSLTRGSLRREIC